MTTPRAESAPIVPRPRVALRIALIYAVAAGAYIFFSDRLLEKMLDEATVQRISEFQTVKGLAFIAVSAMLLYVLIQRGVRRLRGTVSQAERNRRWFEAFMENLPGVAFIKDRDGKHVFVNRQLKEVYPDEASVAVGKTNEQLWPSESAREFQANDRFVAEHRQVLQAVEHMTRNGITQHWLISKFPIEDESGGVAVGGVGIDITQRVESEQRIRALNAELQQANGLKDQFLAVMSHELRTPITAIRLWAQLLRDGDPQSTREAVEMIEQSAAVQAQLIEDLLDVSRILTGRLQVELRSVDPLPAIQAAANAVQPSAQQKDVYLHLQMPRPASLRVQADPKRLQQMTWNLLTNAVKFTPPGGRVDVIVERDEAVFRLTVRDTGKGISAEFLPHLFEQFRQADTSTTRKHGGLGIGLSIVRHMVQLHRGTVNAYSDGEGKGATFVIELPLESAPALGKEEPPSQPASGGALSGVRVLLVEDQTDARRAMEILLQQAGAKVTAVATAREGLEAARRSCPDVLLSDIAMPDLDGNWLIQQIRADEACKAVRAGVISAYAQPEDRERALSAGYEDYLVKPILGDDLIRFVQSLASPEAGGGPV